MEKRLVLAFFLTIAFFLFWSRIGPKPPVPSSSPAPARQESGEKASYLPEQAEPSEEPALVPPEAGDEKQAHIGNFIITYSAIGGYIRKVSVESPENELPFKDIGFVPQDKEVVFSVALSDNRIEFEAPGGRVKEYIFEDYILTINFAAPSTTAILFSNSMRPSMIDQRYQELFYYQGDTFVRKHPAKIKAATHQDVSFAGARDRYYCLSLLKDRYSLEWVKDDKEKHKTYALLASPASQVQLYIGPQSRAKLQPFGLQGIINYGFFHAISVLMIKLLNLFYFLTRNWGLSIIGFSVCIYSLLFPFTAKSTKAMRRMQQIQPEIEELKKKFKDNPQKLQKETLGLYRKYKINPLGGCLPLFLQLPIFIALYQALLRLVELKGAHFLWIQDLSLPDRLFTLPKKLLFIEHINLLPLLIITISLLQQKITAPSTTASEQKSMGLFFAVFIGVIFYNFPSALVLYWLVQNIFTFLYQLRLKKSRPSPVEVIS